MLSALSDARWFAAALLVVLWSGSAPAATRGDLLSRAGVSDSEQRLIDAAVSKWAEEAGAGRGSTAAVACLEATDRDLSTCVGLARDHGDIKGEGLLLLYSTMSSVTRQDMAGALANLESADAALRTCLPGGDPLWAVMHAASGVLLAANGRHQEAITHYQSALEIERSLFGDAHLDVAWNLFNLGTSQSQLKRWLEAEASFTAADAVFAAHPDQDLNRAACLGSIGAARLESGDPAGSRPFFEQALAIAEAVLDPRQPALAVAVGNLGESYRREGAYAAARPHFERALAICEASLGPEHPQTAVYLERLAMVLVELHEPGQALPLERRALAIRSTAYGGGSTHTAAAAEGLAGVLQKLTRYGEAETLYLRALSIYEGATQAPNPWVASTVAKLAELYREWGDYDRSRPMCERALALQVAMHGRRHPDTAAALLNLANLQRDTGEVALAKLGYEEALAIYSETVGEEHEYTATALVNLAALQENTGDLMSAIPSTERAVAIYEHTVGEVHPWIAVALSNLALMYRAAGELEAAIPLMERAVAVWQATLGPEHPQTAIGLNNLAALLISAGRLAEARTALTSAIEISEKTLGADHPQVASLAFNLGTLERDSGRMDEARAAMERALASYEASLGPRHPEVARVLVELALLRWLADGEEPARQLLDRGFALTEATTEPLLDATSERERIHLIRSRRGNLDSYLSLFDRPGDSEAAYHALLRWKGVVKNSLAAQRATALAARHPGLAEKLAALALVRRQLAEQVFARPDPERLAERDLAITRLTAEKEALERDLAAASSEFRRESALSITSMAEVCRQLKDHEALVDYLRYMRVSRVENERDPSLESREEYSAFVLLGGACEAPIRIEMGASEDIDRAVDRYRGLVERQAPARLLSRQAAALRAKVWDPVVEHLSERRRIWLVPDASLNALPFPALVDSDGRFLIEEITFSLLSSADDLRRLAASDEPVEKGVLLAGGIDYDGEGDGSGGPPGVGGLRGPPEGALEHFGFLDGTAQEVQAIAKAWPEDGHDEVAQLTGRAATETRLRAAISEQRILHLATHGFFATGAARSALDAVPDLHARFAVEGEPQAGYNPMLLSGLVLAGANADGGPEDDGLLTAEEVAGLDLSGTELVTLSACNTGLGDVRGGQGVMGLRRAFSLAGARSLVMSLWKVSDDHTQRLMTSFYDDLFEAETADKAEALRASQLQLIDDLRSDGGEAHPFYWAAFVVSGR